MFVAWRTVAQLLLAFMVLQNMYLATTLHREPAKGILGCRLRDLQTGRLLEKGGIFQRTGVKVPHTERFRQGHHYEALYAKYLDPLVDEEGLRMVEIGLGCARDGGPGGEVELWRRMFGQTLQYFAVEPSKACEAEWKATIKRMMLGGTTRAWYDASCARSIWGKRAHDKEAIDKLKGSVRGGQFDLVVDPGGRTHAEHIKAFESLFPLLAPGGVYFLEGLETSFQPRDDNQDAMLEMLWQETTAGYLQRLVADLQFRPEKTASRLPRGMHERVVALSTQVRSVDCDRGICAVTKRRTPWVPDLQIMPGLFEWPCKWTCAADDMCRCKWGHDASLKQEQGRL